MNDQLRGLTASATTSRRDFLRIGATAAFAAGALPALAACTGGGASSTTASKKGTVTWWDSQGGFNPFFNKTFIPKYQSAHQGVTIKRENMTAAKLVQALQLARRSNQLPDVFSVHPTLGVPAALVENGWFQPLQGIDFDGTFVKNYLYEGIHVFGGKVYSFPFVDTVAHESTPWVNQAMVKTAEVDPSTAQTWDGFRAALRAIQAKNPGVHGLVFPVQQAFYPNEKLVDLASMAGFVGTEGVDWKTGEYVWNSQPFLDTMEYFVALQKDGLLHPGGATMAPQDAMQRWMAGEAGVFLWGPYVLASRRNLANNTDDAAVDAWRIPYSGTQRGRVYMAPSDGNLWLSHDSKNADIVGSILGQLNGEEAYKQLAVQLNSPPIDYHVVDKAGLPKSYTQTVAWDHEDTKIGPAPEARNPDYAKVLVEMRDVHPSPGEIVTSVLTGASSDYKTALTKYNDAISKERDRALKAAQAKGAKVSLEDWVFSNWDPATDFTADKYK